MFGSLIDALHFFLCPCQQLEVTGCPDETPLGAHVALVVVHLTPDEFASNQNVSPEHPLGMINRAPPYNFHHVPPEPLFGTIEWFCSCEGSHASNWIAKGEALHVGNHPTHNLW